MIVKKHPPWPNTSPLAAEDAFRLSRGEKAYRVNRRVQNTNPKRVEGIHLSKFFEQEELVSLLQPKKGQQIKVPSSRQPAAGNGWLYLCALRLPSQKKVEF